MLLILSVRQHPQHYAMALCTSCESDAEAAKIPKMTDTTCREDEFRVANNGIAEEADTTETLCDAIPSSGDATGSPGNDGEPPTAGMPPLVGMTARSNNKLAARSDFPETTETDGAPMRQTSSAAAPLPPLVAVSGFDFSAEQQELLKLFPCRSIHVTADTCIVDVAAEVAAANQIANGAGHQYAISHSSSSSDMVEVDDKLFGMPSEREVAVFDDLVDEFCNACESRRASLSSEKTFFEAPSSPGNSKPQTECIPLAETAFVVAAESGDTCISTSAVRPTAASRLGDGPLPFLPEERANQAMGAGVEEQLLRLTRDLFLLPEGFSEEEQMMNDQIVPPSMYF